MLRPLALPPTGVSLPSTPTCAACQDVCECLSALVREPAQEVLLHLRRFLTAIVSRSTTYKELCHNTLVISTCSSPSHDP